MKTINDNVSVTYKNGNGVEETKTAAVSYSEFESVDDVLTFLSSADEAKQKNFIGCVNYGLNLKARAAVRSTVLDQIAGPDKAVNKAVETLVKAMAALGVPFTEEQARKQIMQNAGK